MKPLSFEARGVLAWSQDNHQPLTVKALVEYGLSDYKARKLIHELIAAGLVVQTRQRQAHGRMGAVVYTVIGSHHEEDIHHVVETHHVVSETDVVSNAPVRESAPVREELNTKTQEKENTQTARTRLVSPGRTKPHSRKASPEKPSARTRPYDDVEYGVRFGIINAWCSNLRAQPIGAFKSDANHETAAELVRAGYGEQDVERFVQAKRNDRWWDGKTLTLQKVAELLPEWLAANKPKPRISNADAFLSEDELNAMRPTGTEYLVTYVQ